MCGRIRPEFQGLKARIPVLGRITREIEALSG